MEPKHPSLFCQKKDEQEIHRERVQRQFSDYEIFMAQVKAIGHDKRGNTLYLRNEDGEEILVPPDPIKASILERTADGQAVVRPLPPQKIVDDNTPIIADEFLNWKETAVLGW